MHPFELERSVFLLFRYIPSSGNPASDDISRFNFFLMFIYFEREKERVRAREGGRGREREGDRRSEAGFVLRAQSLMREAQIHEP